MCGFLTRIALLDDKLRWIGEVAIYADGERVSLVNDPLRPTKGVSAFAPMLAREVLHLMDENVPAIVDQKCERNPCIRQSFQMYRKKAEPSARPYGSPAAGSPSGQP